VAFTVAIVVAAEVYVKLPPEMKKPFASLPRASRFVVPLMATVAVAGVNTMLESDCETFSVA